MARWQQVVDEAPEFARTVQEVFDGHLHKTLATLRRDVTFLFCAGALAACGGNEPTQDIGDAQTETRRRAEKVINEQTHPDREETPRRRQHDHVPLQLQLRLQVAQPELIRRYSSNRAARPRV
mgnify:CR=1 FL=1